MGGIEAAPVGYIWGVHSASAPADHAHLIPAKTPLPWAAIGLGCAAMCVLMGSRSAFAVMYPAMVDDLGWSIAEVTGAFSAGLLVYAPSAVAVGFIVDRAGVRTTMLIGCGCLIVGMAVVAFATELWHLYLAYILSAGFGSAGIGFITVIKLLSLRASRRFAAAFGLASLGQGIGTLVLSPAIQWVIELSGWRAGAVTMVALVGLGLLPLVLWLGPPPEEAGGSRGTGSQRRPTRALSWTFATFFVGNCALGYQMLLPTHQVAHLIEMGFAPIAAATAAGWWGAVMAVGSLAGGWTLERLGNLRLVTLAVVLFGFGTAALIASRPDAVWLILTFVIVGGLGRGMLGTALAAAQTRALAGPRLGQLTGLLDLGFGIGAFAGPWLTAVAHDPAGGFWPGIVSAIAVSFGVAFATLVGSRLAFRTDERR